MPAAERKKFSFEPFDLVIFDLDGTLIDSSRDIAQGVNHALEVVGLPRREIPEVVSAIGHGAKSLVRKMLGKRLDLFEGAFAAFTAYYSDHLLDYTRLLPGVRELLPVLDGRRLAVISNKRQMFCGPILAGLGVAPYFFAILGGDVLPRMKPHPDPLLFVAQKAGVSPERGVIIGDSPIDVSAGRAAGMRTVGLTDGYNPPEEVRAAEPDFIFRSIEELRHCLA